ncbi:MAG: hypothetical protein ACJ762_01340 [Solirubrobacteraceae bacterium]
MTKLVIALAGLCVLAPASSAAGSHCRGTADDAFYETATAVVEHDTNYEDRDVWRACWKPTGRVERLAVVRLDRTGLATQTMWGFSQHGGWLAWGRYGTQDPARSALRSVNLRTGKMGQRVRGAFEGNGAARLPATGGPLPVLDPPYYALAANGNFGWLVQGRHASAVYVPDGAGGSRRISIRAGSSSIRRLGTRGTQLVWTAGGREHVYSLSTAP